MSKKVKPQLGEVKPGYKWRDFFDTNYVASWDLDGDTTVTITKVMYEEITGDKGRKDKCLVIYLHEFENGMIVNATNSKTIQQIYNEKEPAKWVGKRVTLYVDPNVSIKGEKVGGIRIRPVAPRTNKEAISGDRYTRMIDSIRKGEYTKEKAIQRFALTAEQQKELTAL